MSDLLIHSFLMSTVSESLRSLIKNERCERIAQVAHQKLLLYVFYPNSGLCIYIYGTNVTNHNVYYERENFPNWLKGIGFLSKHFTLDRETQLL